jgi:hypothetical protein
MILLLVLVPQAFEEENENEGRWGSGCVGLGCNM